MSQKVLDEILGSLSAEETEAVNAGDLSKKADINEGVGLVGLTATPTASKAEGLVALEKEAGYANTTITNTEGGIKYPPKRKGPDSTSEKKLGLLGLTPGKHATEEMADSGVAGQASTNAGTEGIKVPKMKKGNDSVLEKQAAVMSNLEGMLGMDLEKTASAFSDEETLEKLAHDTLATSLSNLDKVAMDMADAMAERFLDQISKG